MIETLKRKKRIIVISIAIIILFIFLIIFYKIFSKNNYKISEIGNNMSSKDIKEIEEYILNISSYEATIEATVESNKNTNKYILLQKYIAPNMSKQTVLEPSNLEGIEITYDGQNLKVSNSKLNISKIYENYEYIVDNVLCLESFISDYKTCKETNNTNLYEQDNNYVFETNILNSNKYREKKKLYINKNTGKPTKLLVQDINEKTLVYILYNEIKLNGLNKSDILAFKMSKPYALAI